MSPRCISLEKVKASLDTICPKCGRRIEPNEMQRVSSEKMKCQVAARCLNLGRVSEECFTNPLSHLVLVTYVGCTLRWKTLVLRIVQTRKLPKHHSTASTSIELTATQSPIRIQLGKRRSTRLTLNSTVGLSGQDREKCPFTMPARATNLNRHGAAVQLRRDLLVGSIIAVKNKRGTEVSARVVSQLVARDGVPTYAIEFVEHDDKATEFWGITFPSAN